MDSRCAATHAFLRATAALRCEPERARVLNRRGWRARVSAQIVRLRWAPYHAARRASDCIGAGGSHLSPGLAAIARLVGRMGTAPACRNFNDHESQRGGASYVPGGGEHRSSVPSLNEMTRFYRDTFYKAQMESDCIIMSCKV